MADASTSTRCYWIRDQDGAEILIPMCWGAAIGGPAECTCNVPESRIEAAERGRAEAEAQVLRLREVRLEAQAVTWRENKRLRERIAELETLLAGKASC
ncbi:hypothetical protein JMK10_06320 [Rhodovulum sulfidophilum]|uniref:hypothetical protein n=1 Tax=Rhodovulum sulfidophilum TaxID=35806 RepID=UPI001921B355|nr:hypothetical protein [Rhodovulum sulfidophilum]MBL3576277.1 hypothetical protein [Rhodovulum sulfidophilum]MCE8433904.1 hypothetical protein [Rhodovulum sulfidophilum]MCF4116428.1 hypothetical protein [Rhodovulum sulfidophilum]